MKTSILFCTVCLVLACSCSSSEKDSVKQAHQQNLNSAIDEDISKFLTQAADARMMDIEEGQLAKERGTSDDIRRYGERMITDHTKLLHEIRVLAASKNIILPSALSEDKADGLDDLRKQQGEAFDKKFVRMMTTDHKRDRREFDDATNFKDKDVRLFASQYLPVIEAHLEQIQEVEEKMETAISERNAGDDGNQ